VRSNILEKYPKAYVRVYTVWFNVLAGDWRDLVDRRVLDDPRVTNYYDADRVVGSWFAQHTGGGGIVWDAYFLYGPDAAWSSEPRPLSTEPGHRSDSSTPGKGTVSVLVRQ